MEPIDDGSPVGMFVGNPDHEGHEQGYKPHRWFSALMRQKWFCDLVRERWEQIKDTLEETAYGAIDEIKDVYADEMKRNFEAWGLTGNADVWDTYVEELRDWISARFDFLDGWYSDPETLYSYVK